MGAAECGEFVDEPRCFIVVVKQKITCEQAQELGSVLGRAGFQGDFLSGTAARELEAFQPEIRRGRRLRQRRAVRRAL